MEQGKIHIKRLAEGIAEGIAHAVGGLVHANVSNEQTIRVLRQEIEELRQRIEARDARIRDLEERLTQQTLQKGAQLDRATEAALVEPVTITLQEFEVLKHLRKGLQNKLIAHKLEISESTVKVHLQNLRKKLGVSNRTAAATFPGEVQCRLRRKSAQPDENEAGTVLHFPDGEQVAAG